MLEFFDTKQAIARVKFNSRKNYEETSINLYMKTIADTIENANNLRVRT